MLYSTSSSKDSGTLYAARNSINAKNVSTDPSSNFYASSELIDKFTKAYIVSGALHHLKMESLESEPVANAYAGEIGNSEQMKKFIMEKAMAFVEECVMVEFPRIPDYGQQSNTPQCRYCLKMFQRPKSLRKHESTVHGHVDPLFTSSPTQPPEASENADYVLNYTKLGLMLGLLRLDQSDAIQMGDGERILRIDSVLYLYYKICHCPKYAFGMLETLAQARALLSERMAHRLIWNRTVNHRGDPDSNHPNDLDLEHCNKVFKDEAHSYRGEFTEKVTARVSRSANKSHGIVKNYDKVSSVVSPSGKHTDTDTAGDIITLVRQLQDAKVYSYIPGRYHSVFAGVNGNPLSAIDMDEFRNWMSAS